MNPIPALLALTIFNAHASAPSQQGYGTVTLAGRVVRLEFPTSPIRQLSDDVKNWDGFAYAPASNRTWPDVFPTPGDWAPIGSRFLAVNSSAPAVWRVKVIIATQTDLLSEYPDKLIRQDRSRLDADQVNAVLSSLARFTGWVKAETDGAVNASLDVSIDSEPMYFGEGGLDLKDYLQARFNGGKFESEDKVYRGPYNAVFVIHPGLRYGTTSLEVNGTPCYSLPFYQLWFGGDDPAATNLEAALMINTVYQLEKQRARFGMPEASEFPSLAMGMPSLKSVVESGDWADFASLDDLPFERLSALAKKTIGPGSIGSSEPAPVFRLAPVSPNVTLSIVSDSEKGSVLKYAEKSPVRVGGFALPKADLSKGSALKFWAKSSSRDSLVLRASDGKQTSEYPLSGFIADGKWHQVIVQVPANAEWMSLGPTEFKNRSERIEPGTIEYQFADFQLGNEAALTSNGPDAESVRAQQAATMTAEALKGDPSDLVKLNGLNRRTDAYGAKDEAALIELAHSANARIAEAAIKQLAKLGTPTAKAEIVRLIASSPFERVKQVAALEVGKMGDAKLAGAMSLLFASKNWQTRLAGAKGIAMLPGDEPAVILMTFLQEIDPQIRLAVTEGANTANPVVLKRLLWSAVNDPSDAVRAASCLRLIFSGKAREVAEGYKGIRDDSVWVRIAILKGLAAKPDEAHRGALRIAVVDLSPRVRAEALTAFGTLKEVSLDEISNTLEDKYPVVQRALIQLAKAKNLTLPKNALDNLKASIDPKVVEMAREVGN